MGFSIALDETRRTIVVRHEEPLRESFLEGRLGLVEQVERTGYRKALVVIDGSGFGANAFQIHENVCFLSTRLPNGMKMAVALKHEPDAIEAIQFAEVVASNRGLQLKVFDSEEPADLWLQGGTSGPQERNAGP